MDRAVFPSQVSTGVILATSRAEEHMKVCEAGCKFAAF